MEKRTHLGTFELSVLSALVRLGRNAYGVTIRQEIKERTERDVSIGAVYATLDRLEEKGFLTSHLGDATPERGGRAKRYFTITASGAEILSETQESFIRLWSGGRLGKVEWAK